MQEEPFEEVPEDSVKPKKKNILLVILLVFLLTIPTIPVLLYRYAINSSPATSSEVAIEIDQGEGVSAIALDLKDSGLINSPLLFKVYVKLNNLDTKIQAGHYTIPPRTSMTKLAEILQFGRNDVAIRFVEGWRVEQLGFLLEEELTDFDYTKFVEMARDYEGQLFPDTYFFNKDASEKDVFAVLRATFDDKTADLLSVSKLNEAGLTKEEAIILASILEREASKEGDRALIAGILIKRLREGMRLEVDATTQYAVALSKACISSSNIALCQSGLDSTYLKDVDWWPHNLTTADLDVDSPYNTRKNYGLPPAPISSFGLSSLGAVLNAEPSDYYFYLTDSDGVTHFSVTYDEHLEYTRLYLN